MPISLSVTVMSSVYPDLLQQRCQSLLSDQMVWHASTSANSLSKAS
jgi:hypothetical protein